jgi:hypothetical protein
MNKDILRYHLLPLFTRIKCIKVVYGLELTLLKTILSQQTGCYDLMNFMENKYDRSNAGGK